MPPFFRNITGECTFAFVRRQAIEQVLVPDGTIIEGRGQGQRKALSFNPVQRGKHCNALPVTFHKPKASNPRHWQALSELPPPHANRILRSGDVREMELRRQILTKAVLGI